MRFGGGSDGEMVKHDTYLRADQINRLFAQSIFIIIVVSSVSITLHAYYSLSTQD
jgi:hypothetical protein